MSATTKFTNKLSRKISEAGRSVTQGLSKKKKQFKNLIRKLGSGRQVFISKIRSLQKQIFKKLHKETHQEILVEQKKQLETRVLKESLANNSIVAQLKNKFEPVVSSNEKITESVATATAKTTTTATPEKWSKDVKIPRSLFIKKIKDYVAKSKLKWIDSKKSSRDKKKFVFLHEESGELIHLFSMPFFNDVIHTDTELISWQEFKSIVFYDYLDSRDGNINKIQLEIVTVKQIKLAFKELLTEKNAAAAAAAATNKGEAAVAIVTVSHQEIRDRLKEFKAFDVDKSFWELECFSEKNLSLLVTEDEFIRKSVQGKTIEQLEVLLMELREEQRISVDYTNLNLTSTVDEKASIVDESRIDYDDEDSDESESDDNDSEYDGSQPSRGRRRSLSRSKSLTNILSSSSSSSSKKEEEEEKDNDKDNNDNDNDEDKVSKSKLRFFEEVKSIIGIPYCFLDIYNRSNRDVRIILRQLILAIRHKKITEPLDVAAELHQNNTILFLKAIREKQLKLDGEKKLHEREGKERKKKWFRNKSDDEKDQEQKEEWDDEEYELALELKELNDKYNELNELFKVNYRSELLRARKKIESPPFDGSSASAAVQFIDASQFAAQVKLVNRVYKVSTNTASAPQDVLDYSSELNEPLDQTALTSLTSPCDSSSSLNYGYLYAIKTLKEWQEFHNSGSIDRLSLEFLKSLLLDYNKESDQPTTIVDALQVVQNYGMSTEAAFEEFIRRPDNDSEKPRAKIMTHSLKHMFDSFARVNSAADLIVALDRYGPALITLPVYDIKAISEYFWVIPVSEVSAAKQSSDGNDDNTTATALAAVKPQAYHTLIVSGYDSNRKVFKLRNSFGKRYGQMGSTEICFDNAFTSNSQVIICIDGGSRHTKAEKSRLDPISAKLLEQVNASKNVEM